MTKISERALSTMASKRLGFPVEVWFHDGWHCRGVNNPQVWGIGPTPTGAIKKCG